MMIGENRAHIAYPYILVTCCIVVRFNYYYLLFIYIIQ